MLITQLNAAQREAIEETIRRAESWIELTRMLSRGKLSDEDAQGIRDHQKRIAELKEGL